MSTAADARAASNAKRRHSATVNRDIASTFAIAAANSRTGVPARCIQGSIRFPITCCARDCNAVCTILETGAISPAFQYIGTIQFYRDVSLCHLKSTRICGGADIDIHTRKRYMCAPAGIYDNRVCRRRARNGDLVRRGKFFRSLRAASAIAYRNIPCCAAVRYRNVPGTDVERFIASERAGRTVTSRGRHRPVI
ncbi:MAG: hypothetical protein LKM35_06835 [Lachnospiraceae bacterium]|nr:hypothetical protein [Lachnospiraceae bacterium]